MVSILRVFTCQAILWSKIHAPVLLGHLYPRCLVSCPQLHLTSQHILCKPSAVLTDLLGILGMLGTGCLTPELSRPTVRCGPAFFREVLSAAAPAGREVMLHSGYSLNGKRGKMEYPGFPPNVTLPVTGDSCGGVDVYYFCQRNKHPGPTTKALRD